MNYPETFNSDGEKNLDTAIPFTPFRRTLKDQGLSISRDIAAILQINVGLLCNQACRHCHLDAGPSRKEIMGREVIDQVTAYAQRNKFETTLFS